MSDLNFNHLIDLIVVPISDIPSYLPKSNFPEDKFAVILTGLKVDTTVFAFFTTESDAKNYISRMKGLLKL